MSFRIPAEPLPRRTKWVLLWRLATARNVWSEPLRYNARSLAFGLVRECGWCPRWLWPWQRWASPAPDGLRFCKDDAGCEARGEAFEGRL